MKTKREKCKQITGKCPHMACTFGWLGVPGNLSFEEFNKYYSELKYPCESKNKS